MLIDVLVRDDEGATPLHYAVKRRDTLDNNAEVYNLKSIETFSINFQFLNFRLYVLLLKF